MKPSTLRTRIASWLLAVGACGILLWFLWPAAAEVETAEVRFGPLQVTIDEDGRTRVKERYVVSAPLEGQLLRVAVKAGDPLVAGETVLASLVPKSPEMLDERVHAEAAARLHAAEAARQQAERRLAEAREAHELAKHQFERAGKLLASRTITSEDFETLEHRERMAAENARAAEFALQVARFEVELAEAALQFTQPAPAPPPAPDTSDPATPREPPPRSDSPLPRPRRLDITAPVNGQVFRVLQESAQVVRSGTPLLEVGNAQDLEVEIDLLSADAVRVKPGAKVWLEHWGGAQPLLARVRLIEPSGFTKVSALGVEEQRVNVIADFADAVEQRPRLGDGFRVEARVVEWETDRTLVVPAGALFRQGQDWAVFRSHEGRARLTPVRIGHHNGRQAEVLAGLAAGDRVILHPADRIRDGSRLRETTRAAH